MSEALEDADDSAERDDGQEGLVLDDLRSLIFDFLGFGLVVDAAFFDVFGGSLGGFGVGLGGGGLVEVVAVEEVLLKELGKIGGCGLR